jgi:magnesium-protoporphyrin IX monomethyl ester (oxidative) cyclase
MAGKTKVLLINPPFTSYGKPVDIRPSEPLGLMSLASFLRERDIGVGICDASVGRETVPAGNGFFRRGLDEAGIEKNIAEFSPDIVGIASMFTMHSKGAHDVARIAKKVSKEILVVFGGSHASALPDTILRDPNADIVVIGEGEETLFEVSGRLSRGGGLNGIPGTAARRKGRIEINPARPFIKDIDTLPFPARDLVDMDIYLKDAHRNNFSMASPRVNLVTSRGCPFECVFCSIHSIWRHNWRGFSAGRVCDEIEYLVKEFSVKEVAFQDDNLTLDKDRMHGICDEILKRRIKIKWCTPNGTSIWTLDRELLRKMKKSGCYRLSFGIETGSLKTQEFINKKKMDLGEMDGIIRYCNDIGIWTNATFIIGFPYETKEDIQATLDFALGSDLDYGVFFIATPFPGTRLYDICSSEKMLVLESGNPQEMKWTGAQETPMCDTKYLKKEELEIILEDVYRKFYGSRIRKFINPKRILRKLTGMPEIGFFLKLVRMQRAIAPGMNLRCATHN